MISLPSFPRLPGFPFPRASRPAEAEQAAIPLTGVRIDGTLNDFMADIRVAQTYTNAETKPIEAVYTFPLPVDAVLLDLEVRVGERVLKGSITPKKLAETRYEDAMTDGDMAIRLEEITAGLYTLSAGNLLPGETAVVRFRYGQLHVWNGDTLRFRLPTVIADRYGDPLQAGLLPHQVPASSPDAEHPFQLHLRVQGLLAACELACPTHRPAISPADADGKTVCLNALLDRDLILNFRRQGQADTLARTGRDENGVVAAVRFQPRLAPAEPAPHALALVVDCSGSMNGDSIKQAQKALLHILDRLRPGDSFNITRFGSDHASLAEGTLLATPKHLAQARQFVTRMKADMGGTELGGALRAVYAADRGRKAGTRRDILLITDGEVMADKALFREAQTSGCRIFTVGVGAAVAEDVVRGLAEQTGGACELVTPNEDMAERIVRHFQRMDGVGRQVDIRWPGQPEWTWPGRLEQVFDGDTFYLFARYAALPEGVVSLRVEQDGESHTWSAALPPATDDGEEQSALARMAAARRVCRAEDEAAGEALALRYRLVSRWTDYLMVDARTDADKARELPVLRTVPQMQAAGWGGAGSVMASCLCLAPQQPRRSRRSGFNSPALIRPPKNATPQRAGTGNAGQTFTFNADEETYDLPACFSRDAAARLAEHLAAAEYSFAIAVLNSNVELPPEERPAVDSLAALEILRIPEAMREHLRRLVDSGENESVVVRVFLFLLTDAARQTIASAKLCKLCQRGWDRLPTAERERVRAALQQTQNPA